MKYLSRLVQGIAVREVVPAKRALFLMRLVITINVTFWRKIHIRPKCDVYSYVIRNNIFFCANYPTDLNASELLDNVNEMFEIAQRN